MKIYKKEIVIYELDGQYDNFCMEVHNNETETELYLYHKQYGIKMHMIGVDLISNDWEIADLIDGYINGCVEEYLDEFITEEIA